jgi:hypothetical protein
MLIQSLSGHCLRSHLVHGLRSIMSRERSEAMRPAHPCVRLSVLHLAWVLSLMVLVGLSGCGPASPSDPANVESHTAKAGASPSEQAPVSSSAPTTQTASPVSLASSRSPADHSEARPAEPLVVPAWMVKELDSPDVRVRLRALDAWVQQEQTGSVDPLLLAMEDEDERVQARALALIEQDWVRAQAEEK